MKVKVAQSFLTLCNLMDHTIHGILQARRLEWVAFLFSRDSSQPKDRTQVCTASSAYQLSQNGRPYMEEEMAAHYSILAWDSHWTETPTKLKIMGLQELDTT